MNYIAQQTCHYSLWLNHAPLERQVTVSKELLARWRGEKGVTVSNLGGPRNPFDAKYSKVEDADWETCSLVLDPITVKEQLSRGW